MSAIGDSSRSTNDFPTGGVLPAACAGGPDSLMTLTKSLLLLVFRREVLEQLVHGLLEPLLVLLRILARVQRLGCRPLPHQLLRDGVVDVECERPDLQRAAGRRRRAAHAAIPPAVAT